MDQNSKQLLLNTICLRRRLMPSCRLSWLSLWPHLISSQVATTDAFWPHFYIFGLFRSHAISQNKLSGLISPFWRHILTAAIVAFMCFLSYLDICIFRWSSWVCKYSSWVLILKIFVMTSSVATFRRNLNNWSQENKFWISKSRMTETVWHKQGFH